MKAKDKFGISKIGDEEGINSIHRGTNMVCGIGIF